MLSNQGKWSSNKVTRSPRHHIEITNVHDKTILTRTLDFPEHYHR